MFVFIEITYLQELESAYDHANMFDQAFNKNIARPKTSFLTLVNIFSRNS